MALFKPKARAHNAVTGQGPKPLKIVVGGPFASGKTTLIKTISEVTVVGTEANVSDGTSAIKHQTTVAMDFGRLTFGEDCSLHLFGAPGQKRFDMMWEILAEGMIGFILLVPAGQPRSIEEARAILDAFREHAEVPYVVGVTHVNTAGRPVLEIIGDVRTALGCPLDVEVQACDARSRDDVKSLMLTILFEVLDRLEREPAVGRA